VTTDQPLWFLKGKRHNTSFVFCPKYTFQEYARDQAPLIINGTLDFRRLATLATHRKRRSGQTHKVMAEAG
jgi:hypothetical protein